MLGAITCGSERSSLRAGTHMCSWAAHRLDPLKPPRRVVLAPVRRSRSYGAASGKFISGKTRHEHGAIRRRSQMPLLPESASADSFCIARSTIALHGTRNVLSLSKPFNKHKSPSLNSIHQ